MSLFGPTIEEKGKKYLISGLNSNILNYDLRKKKLSRAFYTMLPSTGIFSKKFIINSFFLPELFYIISQLPFRKDYNKLLNLILTRTWMISTLKEYASKVDLSKIKDLNYQLKSYQKDFILEYDNKKSKYNLNGYILSFEQGLGKTFTSLALMHCLEKESIVIIAPKSIIRNVWKNEIDLVFKENQDIWVIGEKPKKSRFYIVNYESIEKLSEIINFLSKDKLGIIVDECHNFRISDAKRVVRLVNIARQTNCKDILLMSGTPIKALGSEMIPALDLLDPLFDLDARNTFINAFSLSKKFAIEILKNRMGLIMHRKTKEEVLKLPEKKYYDIKVKFPGAENYTLESVKEQVKTYITERSLYYKKNFKKYEKDFDTCLEFLNKKFKKDQDFKRYEKVIKILRKRGYVLDLRDEIRWVNEYEKIH